MQARPGRTGLPGLDRPWSRTRLEARRHTARLVEYTPFPRGTPDLRERTGLARDLSASGLCVAVDAPETIGSLLRLALCDAAGRPSREAVARVVWCHELPDAHWRLGLQVVGEARIVMDGVEQAPAAGGDGCEHIG